MSNRVEDDDNGIWLRFRRLLVKSTGATVAIVVCLVLYELVSGQGSLNRLFGAFGITQSSHLGSYVLIALMIFTGVVRISCNNLNTWSTESEVDSFHRRHNTTNLIILTVIGNDLVNRLVEKFTSGDVPPLYIFIYVTLFLLGLVSEIVFGPLSFDTIARDVFKDEFFRAMRAKAGKVGYAAAMLASCVALMLLNWYQVQATYLLCAVLYASVAASLLYYDYLIWRADRDC
jgi:hypothetical protein